MKYELNKIYQGDCMEYMKDIPDNYFELAIVDPPYGSSIMAKNKHQRHRTTATTYRNKSIPPPEYYQELYRVSDRQIIWGCQYQLPFMKPEGSFIIWNKKADPDLHNMSSCDVAWYSKRKQIKTFDGHWCGAVKCESEPTIHIHQKPKSLYKWLLKNYAKEGDKILDTHLGSASSIIACIDMGFDFMGIELDEEYFQNAQERVNRHLRQMDITRDVKFQSLQV